MTPVAVILAALAGLGATAAPAGRGNTKAGRRRT